MINIQEQKIPKESYIVIMLFFGFAFLLTRSFPFIELSWLMNVFLVLLYVFIFKRIIYQFSKSPLSILFFLMLCLHFLYSVVIGNNIDLIIRFYLIIIILIFAYFSGFHSRKIVTIFLMLVSIQAIVITVISLYMTKTYGAGDYSIARQYFLINDYGDVYTYGSGFYRVQLKGNALIPFAFMISVILPRYMKIKRNRVYTVILGIGCIVAGNFAYFISLALFFMYIVFFSQSNHGKFAAFKKMLLAILLLVGLPYFVIYAIELVTLKSWGQASSLGIRWDQFHVLINDLTKSPINTIFGGGLGNIINAQTIARDYSEYIYYELQSIYLLNQLGLLIFPLFIILNITLAMKYIKEKDLILCYVLYVTYAITNPYIFDSNHVMVIIILTTLHNIITREKYIENLGAFNE